MPEPKISVLMPAYNAAPYIGQAIESVLKQSFSDFELLIIDDGSTDETTSLIRAFSDSRIRLIHQENQGVSAALNRGLAEAKAPYIARFDADDICYPERLAVQYHFMESHPEYSVLGSAIDYVDVKGDFIYTYHPPAYLYKDIRALDISICPFIHSSVFYRKETVLKAGGYNVHAYTFEDHLLWVSLLKKEKMCNLAQVLIQVRLNPASVTIDERWRTPLFRKMKYEALRRASIGEEEGQILRTIGKEQNQSRIKEGSYHALLGKKYLWNNFQPLKARENLRKAIAFHPFHLPNYPLWLLSFFPHRMIHRCYQSLKKNKMNLTYLYGEQ